MLHPEEQPRAFRLPVKRLVIGAVVCALCLAAACTQAVLFNDARWVKPMELSTYTYQPGDLPMLAAGALLLVYIFYVIVTVGRAALAARRAPNDTPGYTRRLSPWWGLCGVFGFIGFLGFWTWPTTGEIFPFVFFIFFGMFGLYFEGKLSHTMADEMYWEHKRAADAKAYKIGFQLLFVVLWLAGLGLFSRRVEWCAVFMLIACSLIYALVLFLSSYLLYRYERGEE